MSNEAITWAFKQDGLTMTEKFVLIALADYADDNHTCFPSHKKTAQRVAASKSTVQRALNGLEAKGKIRVIPGQRANGSATSNRYQLCLGGQIEQGGVVTVTRGHGHSDQGAMVTGDHPLTPSSNPQSNSASRRKPSRPIPEDWSPLDRHREKAREKHLDLNVQAEAFTNHALANDRRCVNWDRAFDNWLLKAHPSNQQPPWKVDNSLNPFDRSNYE